MGTTLTGLTPATTYDALIKVGDNGPLSATAKYVGDGLGNDSVVALSTSRVGIGTTSPTQLLHVAGNVRITGALYDGNNAAGTSGQILSSTGTATDWVSKSDLSLVDGSGTANYVSKWSDTDTLTNSVIYDNGSAVGIGTTSNSYTSAGRGNLNIAGSAGAILGFQIGGSPKGYVFHDNTNLQLWNEVAGDLLFGANATERMRITSTGLVGIGTSSPARTLNVSSAGTDGTQLQINGTVDSAGIKFVPSSGDNWEIQANTSSQWFVYNRTDNAYRLLIDNTGNVGIGTSSAATRLHVVGGGQTTSIANAATTSTSRFDVANPSISLGIGYVGTDIPMLQSFNNGTNGATNLTINPFGGNVGIFTASPAYKLEVNGNAYCTDLSLPSAGGIYFDSGASKYLDDYEVGTWTMGISFGGASVGVTYVLNTGRYTKIGRQVTASGYLVLSSKGSSTGDAAITGLPFTSANDFRAITPAALRVDSLSFANAFQAYVDGNVTIVSLGEVTEAGVASNLTNADFQNGSAIMVSVTYTV